MIAAVLLLAAAARAWPRFESAAVVGKRELLAIHVPKAGGTSFFRALELARCGRWRTPRRRRRARPQRQSRGAGAGVHKAHASHVAEGDDDIE